jgi:hypothetical protein
MATAPQTIPGLLVRDLPRDLILSIEDALRVGAERAFAAAQGMHDGHLPHVVGQLRHFHMNEGYHRALALAEATPTPVKGNSIVTGRAGMFTLGRFNIPTGLWINGRRSITRRQMALVNASIEPLVQPSLFGQYVEPPAAVAFFVACFSGPGIAAESIQIAVPDHQMKGWLFREALGLFVQRYEAPSTGTTQADLAKPTLKKGKQSGGGDAS